MATIKVVVEDGFSLENAIPIPNVTGKILAKVIEYCKEHVKDPKFINPILEDELMEFDKKFIKVDDRTLHDLILAANYLNVRGLINLTCQTVADMIKGKPPEEIRKKFNIKYDFSPEEEEELPSLNKCSTVFVQALTRPDLLKLSI
ncbi:hypothetical protein V2J09_020125 [Rumex salicifolius]